SNATAASTCCVCAPISPAMAWAILRASAGVVSVMDGGPVAMARPWSVATAPARGKRLTSRPRRGTGRTRGAASVEQPLHGAAQPAGMRRRPGDRVEMALDRLRIGLVVATDVVEQPAR